MTASDGAIAVILSAVASNAALRGLGRGASGHRSLLGPAAPLSSLRCRKRNLAVPVSKNQRVESWDVPARREAFALAIQLKVNIDRRCTSQGELAAMVWATLSSQHKSILTGVITARSNIPNGPPGGFG